MTLPLDLVLVRHGQSEGNVASAETKSGDHSRFDDTSFTNRPSSTWRLTEKGISQARKSGEWLRKYFPEGFDDYYVSTYDRAIQTAHYLDIPAANWKLNMYLRERDHGSFDVMSVPEREEKYADELRHHKRDPIHFAPPSGESMAKLCERVDRFLFTLHNDHSDSRVIVVCHGQLMKAFRVCLERLYMHEFRLLLSSPIPDYKIYNGQILHYTRRNPYNHQKHNAYQSMRLVCPSTDRFPETGHWIQIQRKTYSNTELLTLLDIL